ncbi:oligosaccharide flippase family protein [Alicycliphilus denitrificans]|uniref:Polysaccharide biosynthesis protein n=1 Tax=Alicycliphilus denitrificans (strain DSM 14773 / CIP 107495 / K601) TaxID=596154 RepID=F4G694_ALIDK|nr:oligosaccharide flippase family protein [Alicycliphilus denitrificans]AEB83125.1 polysaccharide biosynthesis protein [Alicycliphilus denitrificans K601]
MQFLVSNLALVANFVLSIVLARLLTPQDIGIFSMSAVLMAVAHVFRDFGVTAFIKREKELTTETLRNALGVLLITSWSVATIMFFSAPYWAHFFHEARVVPAVQVLALGFVFIPLGAIPMAILSREMAVEKSALITAVTSAVYFGASVMLALADFGPMTMAWANLVNIITTGAMARWVVDRPLPWLPSFRQLHDIVHFGLGNLLTALLKAADNALPDILLGRWMTPAAVGLFSRANSTVNMVGTALLPTVNFFALPYMAKVHHTHGPVAGEYLRASSLINALMLPALAAIAVLAHDIVSLLYGRAWLEAVPAIPWLCLSYAISSLFTLSAPALTGVGKPYAAIGPNAVLVAAKVVCAVWLMDGTLHTFALAVALGQLMSVPYYLWIHERYLGLRWTAWIRSTMSLVAQALLVGCVCLGIRQMLPQDMPPWIAIVVTGVCAMLAFLIGCLLLRLPMADELKRLQHALMQRRRSP